MKRKRAASSPEKRNWKVLVYLAGDNNLSADMVWSLQEMEKSVRKARGVGLSVLYDPAGVNPRRFDIGASPSDGDGSVAELPFVDYPEEAAPRDLLQRFLAERLFSPPRSAHRLLVLSGHGSGAAGEFLRDDDPGSALGIPALGKILEKAARTRSVDVLGLDSCEMGGIEVAYEVRRGVRYLVASEGLVLDAGWPYHHVVESLASRAGSSPRDLAREIARRYLTFYRDYEVIGLSTDVSVLDLERVDPVAESVRALAKAMAEPLSRLVPDGLEEAIELGQLRRRRADSAAEAARAVRNAVLLAHWSGQSYKSDRYADLYDFVEQLLRFSSGAAGRELDAIRKAGEGVLKAVRAAVVLSSSTGGDFQHSHGLSIYFPWSRSGELARYRQLGFHRTTRWADFLDVYLRSTVRMRRDQPEHSEKAARGRGLVLDSEGSAIVPLEPLRRPRVSLPARDVDSGTHKDVDSGTHKGESCRSTMKNPPDGYYRRRSTGDAR